jgi:outer membrane protein assembly factor BamB
LFAIGVDGREKWSVDLEGGTSSVPGITNESVFISTESTLYAFNRNDGSKTWTFSGSLSQRGPTPTGDDAVYVVNALSITAVNVRDGSKRWDFQPEYIDSEPAVADGSVYVADASATFYAIDASSGDQVWSQPLPSSSNGSTTAPVTGDDTVFALSLTDSYESRVTALAIADGTTRWSITLDRRARQRPAVRDGVLYIGDSSNTLYAIDTTDGSTLWQFSTNGDAHGSIAILDETVCVGTSEGTVHAVSRNDGTEQWRFNPGPAVTTDPVAHEGTIYTSLANKLYRLEVTSSEP